MITQKVNETKAMTLYDEMFDVDAIDLSCLYHGKQSSS